MGGACRMHGETTNLYEIMFGKPDGYRLLKISLHNWGDNIKMKLTGTGREGVD
jgi:hypothetical protein